MGRHPENTTQQGVHEFKSSNTLLHIETSSVERSREIEAGNVLSAIGNHEGKLLLSFILLNTSGKPNELAEEMNQRQGDHVVSPIPTGRVSSWCKNSLNRYGIIEKKVTNGRQTVATPYAQEIIVTLGLDL